jgi:hypothetical protein
VGDDAAEYQCSHAAWKSVSARERAGEVAGGKGNCYDDEQADRADRDNRAGGTGFGLAHHVASVRSFTLGDGLASCTTRATVLVCLPGAG